MRLPRLHLPRRLRFAAIGLLALILVTLSAVLSSSHFSQRLGTHLAQLEHALQAPEATSLHDSHLPPTVLQPDRYGSGVRHSLHLLQSSTPEHRNTLRVLFYGQSITKQAWWVAVTNDLRQRFPNANLVFENRSIGGFDSSKLVRVAEHDLYPFYPDLMIFHDFGDEQDYETMIAETRRRTTAEIVLISDHVTWMPTGADAQDAARLKEYEWHNQHSTEWLPQLAEKYGCELIEIRTPWLQYLRDNHLPPQALLVDEIHLNDRGNALMANLVNTHLRQVPMAQAIPAANVQEYRIGSDRQWQNNRLMLEFEGNRVDLIADTQGDSRSANQAPNQTSAYAQILIDHQPPSQFAELYTLTRPSESFEINIPAILRVQAKQPLLLEDWQAVITEINPTCSQFKFDVYSSQSGYEGSGSSSEPFVARSGRVAIDPQDWGLEIGCTISQKPVPVGFQVKWQVQPLFADVYVPPSAVDHTRETATTVAQSLKNGKHTLEIVAIGGSTVPIQSIRVYKPPVT